LKIKFRYVPITVSASKAFRPSQYEPRSSDTCSLGGQLRVELP